MAAASATDELDTEWRKTEWQVHGKNVAMLNQIRLDHPDVQHIRILLNGPVGAGKSSFINSITNVMQDRQTFNALVGNSAGKSFTVKYKTHCIRNCLGVCPFVINDLMGIEENEEGIHTDDIISVLKGRVPDGYVFNPRYPLKDGMHGYKESPTLNDRVHCLVSVVSCNNISLLAESVLDQMKKIRMAASRLDIPQLVVMTMPDIACPLVKGNLKMIYKSKTIKTKMEDCGSKLGVPLNCILPVKNYSDEVMMDHDVSSLILVAMAQICNFAYDYLWNLKKSQSS